MKAFKRRDLTIIPLISQMETQMKSQMEARQTLVIACDSCGGVGMKSGDILKLSPRYTAKFTARVALTEVLCSGALPVTITNGVSCEMDPTGEEMILGIQEELKNAGIADIILTGSTEENFITSMTALAITVIGTSKESDLKFGCATEGDKLILLGIPQFGAEVDLESKGFYPEIRQLLAMQNVKEIVPVGSKGVEYEAEYLAALSNKRAVLYQSGIDYKKSAGPATCLIVLCTENIAIGTVIGEII